MKLESLAIKGFSKYDFFYIFTYTYYFGYIKIFL